MTLEQSRGEQWMNAFPFPLQVNSSESHFRRLLRRSGALGICSNGQCDNTCWYASIPLTLAPGITSHIIYLHVCLCFRPHFWIQAKEGP